LERGAQDLSAALEVIRRGPELRVVASFGAFVRVEREKDR
jgi:hypothetical protein